MECKCATSAFHKEGNLSITFTLQQSTLVFEALDEKSKRKWKHSIDDAMPVATGQDMPTSVLFELLQHFCENNLEPYCEVKIEQDDKAGLIIHINNKPKFTVPISFRVVIPEVEIPVATRLELMVEDLKNVIEEQNKVIHALNQKIAQLTPIVVTTTGHKIDTNCYRTVASAKVPTKGVYLIRITAYLKFTSNRIDWVIYRYKEGARVTNLGPRGKWSYPFGEGATTGSPSTFYPLTAAVQETLEEREEVGFILKNTDEAPITAVGQCILELWKLQ